jgi:acyl-coenzyme A synthetase/AMP-(fatty) acid ligase
MITERIFHWARETPYNTALIYNGERWSYRTFARAIAKARSYFARRGFAGPGHAVLLVRNLGDFWVLCLALRSLGLTTIALRSAAAVQHLELPDLRLVATTAAEDWPELDIACAARELPLLAARLDGETGLPLDAAHAPGGHIVRTSGTTGSDKMVLLSPAIDAFFLPLKAEIAGIGPDSLLCMFDISGTSAAGSRWSPTPWIVGGATLFEQGDISQALRRPGITHAMINPAMLTRLLSAPVDAFPRSDLRLYVAGGAMTRALAYQARARVTPHLFNFLASTEAGPIAVTPLNTPDDHRWQTLLPSRRVELVDDAGHPVAVGEMGHMRVATDGGPLGYVGDEAATGAFFRHGFFYPGDLAIRRADGRIALQGRVTDVINVAGKKISPAPFEERLADVLAASGACLFCEPDESGEERLHLVVETAAPIEAERVRDVLKPLWGFDRAMVHAVTALPRNPMGKVLRRDLRTLLRTLPGESISW